MFEIRNYLNFLHEFTKDENEKLIFLLFTTSESSLYTTMFDFILLVFEKLYIPFLNEVASSLPPFGKF